MSNTDHLTTTISVDRSPDEVFAAITDVRGWFKEDILGDAAELGDEFVLTEEGGIRFSRFRLTEVVPGERVVWHVMDSYLSFVEDHDEWTDTRVIFEITATSEGSTVHLTHEGLTPTSECYGACSTGWDYCIGESLQQLITTGTGKPIPNA